MAAHTEADKRDFVNFMVGVITDNAGTIAKEGKKDVKFDIPGNKKMLSAKNDSLVKEEAKETAMEEQKKKQTSVTNKVLEDAYKTAAEVAESVINHMGKEHSLSQVIRKRRGSMHRGGDQGPAGPPSPSGN